MNDINKHKDVDLSTGNIPTSWDDRDLGELHYENNNKSMSLPLKIFLFSIILFVAASSFAVYNLFTKSNSFSETNIDLSVNTPSSAPGGEATNIPVIVTNRNVVPIVSSYVVLSYDSGENDTGSNRLSTIKVDLGDIESNSSKTGNTEISLYGSEGDKRLISAKLFYSLQGTKAVYNKTIDSIYVSIKSSPVTLKVNSLKEMQVNNNQIFNVSIKNNTDSEINNILIKSRLPNDFVFASSSISLYDNSPSWLIKTLKKGETIDFDFSGKFIGLAGSNELLTFYAGSSADYNSTSTTSANSNLTKDNFDNLNLKLDNILSKIEKNILLTGQYIDISIDNSSSLISDKISKGETVNLNFNYKNNLNYPIDNVSFSIKFSGNGLDLESVNVASGRFDKSTQTAVWDKNAMPSLSQVSAQSSGSFNVSFRSLRDIANPSSIRIQVSAKGDRNSETGISNSQNISIDKTFTVSD